ncbi:MAG: ribosome biogenesis GTPase Der [Rhodospirillaceae bacterium]|nr:ribosome biogenesis GTPase Der [Rhodospirillaceae bacterium]|tara:strand:+ start:47226 stop:48593 length:1368 start_codon:yes stop_codon:yes gene_type:complete
MNFRLVILGRPNVGKSTLFNRLCGVRAALVDPTPGVTRDRRTGEATLGDLQFEVIDTAGLEEGPEGVLEGAMQDQTQAAIMDADAALLVIDARSGITPVDRHFADVLRKIDIPVLLVANKCEGQAGTPGLYEAFELGLGEPTGISAEHGEGLVDLYEVIAPLVDETRSASDEVDDKSGDQLEEIDGPLQMAIVGRPNVGKSTLLNCLLGESRVITGPEPGVTRDAISVDWSWQGNQIKLFDTAGLRRRSRVHEKLEKLSAADTLRAIKFAHVAVLVLDGTVMAERQDLSIAEHVVEEGRALVIAVNKWDLVDDRASALRKLNDRLERSLPQVRGIPIVTLSALTDRGTERLMPAVKEAYDIWTIRLPTGPLNRWLEDILDYHPPPLAKGRRLRLRYITQVKGRPPTFVVFSSRPAEFPESYRRYLINSLRETFGIEGVPIRLNLRGGKNPYVKDG